jgi:4-aminobutyrate aminotransferase
MFCVEQHGIRPDVVVMAKGLASGFPISAVGASAELMARWPTGSHGGTYGGNPIGCAAAIATIDVLTEDGFLANVNASGEQLRAGLHALAEEDGGIVEVRGPGLMVATQLADAARVPRLQEHCLAEGRVILMNAGTLGDAIRWMPPLVVGEAEIDRALDAFAKALAATR